MDPLLTLLDSITPRLHITTKNIQSTSLNLSTIEPVRLCWHRPAQHGCHDKQTDSIMAQHQAGWAIGRYGEHRELYTHPQYTQTQRSVHLGLDLSAPAGTKVFASLTGKCHSFQDNAQPGDYGPTVILEHQINELTFYSLYGHLNREALTQLHPVKIINAGERLGHWHTRRKRRLAAALSRAVNS